MIILYSEILGFSTRTAVPPAAPPRPAMIAGSWARTAYSSRQAVISQLSFTSEGCAPVCQLGTHRVADGRPTADLEASSVFIIPPVGACSCGTDRKQNIRQTCKNRQSGFADTEPCHPQRGQDTSPLSVQWRLEERKRWIPGTP